ncbi:hypothetical protein BC628DRAFT_1395732 [Trametes gibbosa]|nr:hypothetical protein BC628DRAFT_1395732 [Trametes gibbosa]
MPTIARAPLLRWTLKRRQKPASLCATASERASELPQRLGPLLRAWRRGRGGRRCGRFLAAPLFEERLVNPNSKLRSQPAHRRCQSRPLDPRPPHHPAPPVQTHSLAPIVSGDVRPSGSSRSRPCADPASRPRTLAALTQAADGWYFSCHQTLSFDNLSPPARVRSQHTAAVHS